MTYSTEWASMEPSLLGYDRQLELNTVINHNIDAPIIHTHQYTHKPLGVRLAKMLNQYDDSPSSQLWSEIQGLAREILR